MSVFAEAPGRSRARTFVPSWSRGWPRKLYIGSAVVLVFALIAILAPLLTQYSPNAQHVTERLLQPGEAGHLLGTDPLGRDVLTRLLYATRIDLGLGVALALVPMLIGTTVGAIAGYFGGIWETIPMRVADLVQAFPAYVLIVVLVFVLGAGMLSILVSFAVVAWVAYARLIRGEVLRIREADFVLAAEGAGLSSRRVLFRHVLPNVLNQAVVLFATDVVFAVLALSTFSFLGLGLPPPTAEWGAMIAEGREYLLDQWWLSTAPAVALTLLGVGFVLIGDGLDDLLRRSGES